MLILYFINFIISAVPALFYSTPVFEDGLGTMATAAYITGHDWSSFLAEDGFYYKYGQAVWYVLPFILIRNTVIRYKVMLVVNSMLTAFIPVLVYKISVKYIEIDKIVAYMLSFIVGIMPSILLYNKYTWAETNLMLLPWLIILLEFKLFFENLTKNKRRLYNSILALSAVYAFMSHQRGMVVVIATTITVLILFRFNKDNISLPIYFTCMVMGLVFDRVICFWQKANVYGGALPEHNTLADFLKPEVYQKLFSLKGVATVFKTVIGWLYHSTCSTFGMALVGLIFMMVCVCYVRRKRKITDAIEIVAIQGILSYLGAFALGILFFFQCLYDYFEKTDVTRCDHLLFGRYLESSLPVLLYAGFVAIIKYRKVKKVMVFGIIIQGTVIAYTACKLFPLMEGVDCYVHSLMALNLFMDTSKVSTTLDIIHGYTNALLMFGILSLMINLSVFLLHNKNIKVACVLVGVFFIWIYIWNCVTVIYKVDSEIATVYAQYYLCN